MGNSPSIPGLNGGRTHVRGDDNPVGSERGRRPGQSRVDIMEMRILDDFEDEEVDSGEARLNYTI